MSETLTYLAGSASGKIHVKKSKRDIGSTEVLVKVTHSGCCGTDVHDRTSGCGLGHEGVGEVLKIGDGVRTVSVGQRVGWGWQLSSCGHCKTCVTGYRQYCAQSLGQKYGERNQGGFGDKVIKHEEFVYAIPAAIESKHAGPLQCAGITVYEALDVAGVTPAHRVGVVGLGGLGHLAVLYAKAMGCAVVVFSRDASKEGDAGELGADEFVVLDGEDVGGGQKQVLEVSEPMDILLLCGGALPDFELYVSLVDNTRRAIGSPVSGIFSFSACLSLILYVLATCHSYFRASVSWSTEASRKNHIDALTFAARHNIKPWIQEFPMTAQGLTDALDLLQRGEIRYRAVLTAGVDGSIEEEAVHLS